MDGFVYEMPPIDWWPGWSDLDGAIANVEDIFEGAQQQFRASLKRTRDTALDAFRARTSWEGDFAVGPLFSGLPPEDSDASDVMVAVKQSNNGSVYIWSPYELPWLNEYAR